MKAFRELLGKSRRNRIWVRSRLVAAVSRSEGIQHYHVDHLGSPRMVTNRCGQRMKLFDHNPWGLDRFASMQDSERHRFTAHQRDIGLADRSWDDLDYMHARYYSPFLGRFLSVDPVRGKRQRPQSFNLYTYVEGRVVSALDPDGRELRLGKVSSPEDLKKLLEQIKAKTGLELKVVNGKLVVAKDLLKTGDMTKAQVSGVARGLILEAINSDTTFTVSLVSGDQRVLGARSFGPTRRRIVLDTLDLSRATLKNVPSEAFDFSMALFHELTHGVRRLEDPPMFVNLGSHLGDAEHFIVNPIRQKLGLPLRSAYVSDGEKERWAEVPFEGNRWVSITNY